MTKRSGYEPCGQGHFKRVGFDRCRGCMVLEAETKPGKTCTGCSMWKSRVEFGERKGGKNGASSRMRARCRKCETRDQGIRTKADRPRVNAYRKRRAAEVKGTVKAMEAGLRRSARTLGIDPTIVVERFRSSGGICEICKNSPVHHTRLSVDHDHDAGTFRGLICSNCNLILGHAKDSPVILKNCIKYLAKASSRKVDWSS